MATGRTISATFLTEKDKAILDLCQRISEVIEESIKNKQDRKIFKSKHGKISYTRDAGLGLGGGKLQRDALCTRGIQGKAPFSNRNIRWHPLVAAEQPITNTPSIERIEIEGEDESQSLIFVVKIDKKERKYPSERTYELPMRFAVLASHWLPHIDRLKHWSDTLWTQNSCLITAYEAADWNDSIESYAVLGIAIAVNEFKVKFEQVYEKVAKVLFTQNIDKTLALPSRKFPIEKADIISCPLCLVPANRNPSNMPEHSRGKRWKPDWSSNKRAEGDESSLQIMHILPLTEEKFLHNAQNVRYGHRWCNVSMTDHSVEETVDFMEYIVKAHKRNLR